MIPLGDVGWDPVLVDYEDVLLRDVTPERLLEECDRREDGYERWQTAHIRIGVASSRPKPPTTRLVEIIRGVIGEFNDVEFMEGSHPPRWIHWIYIPVGVVRAALRTDSQPDGPSSGSE